jgi:hypothetical protein
MLKQSPFLPLQHPAIGRKDVVILAVVVAKLKFRNVQREILLAYLTEGADNRPCIWPDSLEDPPRLHDTTMQPTHLANGRNELIFYQGELRAGPQFNIIRVFC